MARTVQGELVAAFRPQAWDFSSGPPEYVVGPGDTLGTIAALYLGSAARAGELRDMQVFGPGTRGRNGPYLNHYASDWEADFKPGVALLMPLEAMEKAQSLGGIAPAAPAAPPPAAPPNYYRAALWSALFSILSYGGWRLYEAYA
jgi:hypothetical protein